jgi:hypothetical protein
MIGAAIGSAIGGLFQARSADRAAEAQVQSANQQMQFNQQVYDDQRAAFQPYQQAGGNALDALTFNLGLGDRPQGYGGFRQSPGYQFQFDQGQRAIDGSAASRGNLFSGATMKAQNQFGTGLAQQDFYNYLGQLGGLAGMGQGAAGMTATAAGNLGAGQGNALSAIGNARAAGAVGVGNAINSGIGNALGTYNYMQMIGQPGMQQTPALGVTGFGPMGGR